MGAGLIQLVSYGPQDIILVGDPQVTLFKTLYRRHTNFAIEPIPQKFNKQNITFGDTVFCRLSRTGDLVYHMYLVVTLPAIPQFVVNGLIDPLTKFSWARKIGYAMISKVTLEIGGKVIDSQTGEWMAIWQELVGKPDKNIEMLIGDVPWLYNPTNGKDAYTLHIPLSLWFNEHCTLALPLVALNHSQVRIFVEFADPDSCYTISPVNQIQLQDNTVHFEPGEYIEQNVNGNLAQGQFVYFDPIAQIMYYTRFSNQAFTALSTTPTNSLTINRYAITGVSSGYVGTPAYGTKETVIRRTQPTLVFSECYLDTEYVYVEAAERARLSEMAQEYLITQVQQAANVSVSSTGITLKLPLDNLAKTLIFVVRTNSATGNNDMFNYTTSPYRDKNGKLIGKNIVTSAELKFNGISRTGNQSGMYYNKLVPWYNFRSTPNSGVNVYSFALHPGESYPSGAANLSMIDMVELKLGLDSSIGINYGAQVIVYSSGWNVLRTINGLGGTVFVNSASGS
jgi:hypothetical protein